MAMSTIYIIGFPPNTLDREIENFCRFMPGFVGAKAAFSDGNKPRAWVKFDTPENAQAALALTNDKAFDLTDPTVVMKASPAKTELNVDHSKRTTGVSCAAGLIDVLIARSTQPTQSFTRSFQPSFETFDTGGMGLFDQYPVSGGYGAGREGYGDRGTKRPRSDDRSGPQDTLVLMGIGTKNLDEKQCKDVFSKLEGYVTSHFNSSGKGGGNFFVKYSSETDASKAMTAVKAHGLDPQIARKSLEVSKLQQ